jgi:hypothetical protein
LKFLRTISVFTAALLSLSMLAHAASISGVVTNKTTGKPAAGDDVVLIRLAQGMQEAGRTKTDAKGHFILDVPDEGLHLVRVTHDKANYFRPVEDPTKPLDMDVFNAAAKVEDVTEEADVMRVETDPGGKGLRVVENFFVKNVSSPPMTQFSDRPFEFYLPAGAVVEGSAALAPGGMPVQAAPVPLGDEPDHYAFIFPVRPGETRFQTTYRLPYGGSLKISPRLAVPTDTVAVMLPKSMKFAGGAPYAAVSDEVDGQTFVARNVQPSQPLEFTVSGSGQLPRDTEAAQQGDAAASGGAASGSNGDLTPSEASARQRADSKPGVGLNNPLDSDGDLEPWAKYKWWILGVLGLALAAGAGLMLRANPAAADASAGGAVPLPAAPGASAAGLVAGPAAGHGALLLALKDELFALETDRLAGQLSEPQYAEQKAAFEMVLRRALGRGALGGGLDGDAARAGAGSIEAAPSASNV